jgi:hypothetical protein
MTIVNHIFVISLTIIQFNILSCNHHVFQVMVPRSKYMCESSCSRGDEYEDCRSSEIFRHVVGQIPTYVSEELTVSVIRDMSFIPKNYACIC